MANTQGGKSKQKEIGDLIELLKRIRVDEAMRSPALPEDWCGLGQGGPNESLLDALIRNKVLRPRS